MAYLLDTNILGRLVNVTDSQHGMASHAIAELHRRGEVLHLTPQVLIEFRNVATRPTAQNGLGRSIADTEARAAGFEAAFQLLAETPDVFLAWKALVGALGIIGKQVHDARLVAVCHVHAVTHLLIADLNEAILLNPKDRFSYAYRAMAYRALGKEKEAAGHERIAAQLTNQK